MSAGAVFGKVVLDNPSKYHCGPNDPVTGHVELVYRPSGRQQTEQNQTPSLFGPLKLFLVFHGRAKSKIRKSNGQTTTTYRGRAPLFSQHLKIYDGPVTCEPRKCTRFPFSLNFPSASQPLPGIGDFRQDRRFHEQPGGPLPPTFSLNYTGFSKRTEAFTEYRINASMSMPGINIAVQGLNSDQYSPAVLYEQPRLPLSEAAPPESQQFTNTHLLQNEYLLPEEDRPSGFRQKTKFMFSSETYPVYMYNIITVAPKEAYMGQPLVFEVSIRPNLDKSTAPIHPEIRLSSFHAHLVAYTEVRAEHSLFSSPESDTHDSLPWLNTQVLDQAAPFSKANDYTKVVHTRDGVNNVCTPFSTYNIARWYVLKIEFKLAATGKEETFKRTVPIHIHPPLDDGSVMLSVNGTAGGRRSVEAMASSSSSAPPPAAAGPSSSASASPNMKDLPSPPTPPKPTDLPQYERPPEYDEVLEMRTEDDAPADGSVGKGKEAAT